MPLWRSFMSDMCFSKYDINIFFKDLDLFTAFEVDFKPFVKSWIQAPGLNSVGNIQDTNLFGFPIQTY